MKKILSILILILLSASVFSQTEGISYQAVILNPNEQQLPGVNAQGNILVNSPIAVQFSILNEANVEEFQEYHNTVTDAYGMINLLIGSGNLTSSRMFSDVNWNGTEKTLKVEIDFSGTGNNFIVLSEQKLTYMSHPASTETLQLISDNTTLILEEEIRAKNAEAALQTELDATQTGAGLNADGTYTANASANYISGSTSLQDADNALDTQSKTNSDAIAAETTRATGAESALQTELDATQTGAGLNADGTYTANASANYISGSMSLQDADNDLDAQAKTNSDAIAAETTRATGAESALQTELDATQTGAGLNADGTYTANASANYISGSTSLQDADNALDTQSKTNSDAIAAETTRATGAESALQTELDATQTGAGLNADGTYTANASANYISGSTSLQDADNALDTQSKTNSDAIAAETTRATGAESALQTELDA
ncbi:hypothetical protein ACFOX1_10865, partial [Mariniflexile soesokkakense]